MSWIEEQTADRPVAIPIGAAAGLPNSRRLLPGQLESLKHELLAVAAPAALLGRLSGGSIGARNAGLLAVIETPEAIEAYLLRAQSQDHAKRRVHRCIEAATEAARLAAPRCWLMQV